MDISHLVSIYYVSHIWIDPNMLLFPASRPIVLLCICQAAPVDCCVHYQATHDGRPDLGPQAPDPQALDDANKAENLDDQKATDLDASYAPFLLNTGARRQCPRAPAVVGCRFVTRYCAPRCYSRPSLPPRSCRYPQMVFDYLDAGAADEISLRRGKDAYSELEMHYHIMSGLKPPLDLSTKIFGQDVSLPFFGCLTAGNRLFHW